MKTIDVPEGAYFQDYSAMAYNYDSQKLAILSQEDSAIWVGSISLVAHISPAVGAYISARAVGSSSVMGCSWGTLGQQELAIWVEASRG